MAQLVEHNLAKVGVAGSSPVVRSRLHRPRESGAFFVFRYNPKIVYVDGLPSDVSLTFACSALSIDALRLLRAQEPPSFASTARYGVCCRHRWPWRACCLCGRRDRSAADLAPSRTKAHPLSRPCRPASNLVASFRTARQRGDRHGFFDMRPCRVYCRPGFMYAPSASILQVFCG